MALCYAPVCSMTPLRTGAVSPSRRRAAPPTVVVRSASPGAFRTSSPPPAVRRQVSVAFSSLRDAWWSQVPSRTLDGASGGALTQQVEDIQRRLERLEQGSTTMHGSLPSYGRSQGYATASIPQQSCGIKPPCGLRLSASPTRPSQTESVVCSLSGSSISVAQGSSISAAQARTRFASWSGSGSLPSQTSSIPLRSSESSLPSSLASTASVAWTSIAPPLAQTPSIRDRWVSSQVSKVSCAVVGVRRTVTAPGSQHLALSKSWSDFCARRVVLSKSESLTEFCPLKDSQNQETQTDCLVQEASDIGPTQLRSAFFRRYNEDSNWWEPDDVDYGSLAAEIKRKVKGKHKVLPDSPRSVTEKSALSGYPPAGQGGRAVDTLHGDGLTEEVNCQFDAWRLAKQSLIEA